MGGRGSTDDGEIADRESSGALLVPWPALKSAFPPAMPEHRGSQKVEEQKEFQVQLIPHRRPTLLPDIGTSRISPFSLSSYLRSRCMLGWGWEEQDPGFGDGGTLFWGQESVDREKGGISHEGGDKDLGGKKRVGEGSLRSNPGWGQDLN